MWIFILFLVFILFCFTIIGVVISAPRYRGPVSDHFNGKQFINPGGAKANGLGEVLKWMFQRKRVKWENINAGVFGQRPLAFVKEGIRITFVNHTTFLIQVDGLNILTDPVWSKRVSPFRWAGPRRMREPGIRIDDLPRIHVVLLSHNHYDHLDLHTMRVINGAHHPKIITPLGVKNFLERETIGTSQDLDWWDETSLNEKVNVCSVPAQHFSGRGSLDRDATLWCGYVINTSSGKIYFAGDSGYNEKMFQEIGQRCGDIKLSIIPIGAYKPRWFMSPIHVDPEEAVKIHLDVKSQNSIASHFGTFPLADEGYDEPMTELQAAKKKYGVPDDAFVILKEGDSRDF